VTANDLEQTKQIYSSNTYPRACDKLAFAQKDPTKQNKWQQQRTLGELVVDECIDVFSHHDSVVVVVSSISGGIDVSHDANVFVFVLAKS
jgi:hypothetical protein